MLRPTETAQGYPRPVYRSRSKGKGAATVRNDRGNLALWNVVKDFDYKD